MPEAFLQDVRRNVIFDISNGVKVTQFQGFLGFQNSQMIRVTFNKLNSLHFLPFWTLGLPNCPY